MIHVWITPHPCGPFAALEGVGAGQIAAGEEPTSATTSTVPEGTVDRPIVGPQGLPGRKNHRGSEEKTPAASATM